MKLTSICLWCLVAIACCCNTIKSYYQASRCLGSCCSSYRYRYRPLFERRKWSQDDVVRTLAQEYATFFQPMQKEIYSPNVEFIDPLNSLSGVDKYQDNVDFLGGRAGLGKIFFEDASIVLHNTKTISESLIETRWTLQVTVKVLPWKPRARFTGISRYHLHPDNGKIVKQVDYWDSVNLINGVYSVQDRMEGIKDFWAQVQPSPSASLAAPELPVP